MNRSLLLAFTLVLGFSPGLHAVDVPPPAPATAPPAALDPKVNNILTAATAYYAARKSVECDITSATLIGMTGMKQEMDSSFHLALLRPNSFAFTLQSGMMGGSLVCDGKTVVTCETMLKEYTSKPAPADFTELLEPMNFLLVGGGLPLGFEPFFRKDPFKSFQQDLKSSQDLGLEKSGSVQAHHIQLTNHVYVTDLWIADGDSPVLLQASVNQDMSESLKHLTDAQKKVMPAGMSSMTMTRTTTYSNWKFDQPVAPDTFVFHPPADAELVTAFAAKHITPPAPNGSSPATSPAAAAATPAPATAPAAAPASAPAAATTTPPPSTPAPASTSTP